MKILITSKIRKRNERKNYRKIFEGIKKQYWKNSRRKENERKSRKTDNWL